MMVIEKVELTFICEGLEYRVMSDKKILLMQDGQWVKADGWSADFFMDEDNDWVCAIFLNGDKVSSWQF